MRMSCNGCRVLRKGCSENCSIRPSLQWIKSPESQSNATLFLAKFYGRAGLLNLINAGPEHLRPAIFRSLLYEAAGRIINPIYGSVGLIWSGNWHLCQNAVDCVLKGSPITPIATDEVALPTKGYDIRHVIKDENSNSADSNILNRVKLNRTRFKRSGLVKPKAVKLVARPALMAELASDGAEPNSSTSHGSAVSHPEGADTDSMVSVEMSEAVARADENGEAVARADGEADEDVGEVDLELTLGFEPVGAVVARGSDPRRKCTWDARVGSLHAMGLGLEL